MTALDQPTLGTGHAAGGAVAPRPVVLATLASAVFPAADENWASSAP